MDVKSKPRRRHGAQFKAEVVAACAEPGASVAAVARRFDLNDNLVHQWRRGRGIGKAASELGQAGATPATPPPMKFIAMALPAPAVAASTATGALAAVGEAVAEPIRIEIRRGGATVNVCWPAAAAGDCAAWLRELLR